MHATKEFCRRNISNVDKSIQFSPPLSVRNSLTFSGLFFYQKLLDLNPITCQHLTLSNINPTFPRSLMHFLNQLASGMYLILISLYHSKTEKILYIYISYIDTFQPYVLKYRLINFSHKLLHMNIASFQTLPIIVIYTIIKHNLNL